MSPPFQLKVETMGVSSRSTVGVVATEDEERRGQHWGWVHVTSFGCVSFGPNERPVADGHLHEQKKERKGRDKEEEEWEEEEW